MPGVELAAYAVLWAYVLGFLALTAIVSRASGQSVWLFSAGRERQAVPATLFRVAFVLGLIVPPAGKWVAAAGHWGTTDAATGKFLELPGLVLSTIGAAFALYAQFRMGRSWRIGAAEGRSGAIVDDGPFGISRNPVFVGQAMLFGGTLLAFPTIPQALLFLAVLVAIRMQVGIEERVLSKDLGDAYAAYKSRVRRWL